MASQSGSPVSEIAQRYAAAFFDLAQDEKTVDAAEKELTAFAAVIDGSDDLQGVISSPALGRDEKLAAVLSVLEAGKASDLVRNLVGVLGQNGRLHKLPEVITAFQKKCADARGEVAAEAISAIKLTAAQQKALQKQIEESIGQKVSLATRVDADLLGGLIVKVGSRMIDSSLRTKLIRLNTAMKEA